MPHVITGACIGIKDAACVAVCPMGGIHPTPEEAAFAREEMLYINPRLCIDCGVCIDECTAGAIYEVDEVPEKWQSFIERNAAYYRRTPPE